MLKSYILKDKSMKKKEKRILRQFAIKKNKH